MNEPLKQSSETFTVEQGYYIAMRFFFKLWDLLDPAIYTGHNNMCVYFLINVSCNDRHCAEWNEAVRRLIGLPREKQRTFYLTLSQIFKCTLEYCKLNHNHYKDRLPYIFNLLESMEKEPDKYQAEWNVWEKAVRYVKDFRMNRQTFDWEAEPAFSYE